METIKNVIELVLYTNLRLLVIGLLLILVGVAIGIFKLTWLIGSSTLSYMEDDVVDYLTIFFGLFSGLLGIKFLGVFICTYFEIMYHIIYSPLFDVYFNLFAFFLAVLCLIVIAMIRTRKKKNKENQ